MAAMELKKNILTGRYTLREKHNGKSPIWTIFREILNEHGVQIPHWVACNMCRNVYCYDNRKLGTSNLLKHKCGKGRVMPRSSLDHHEKILDGCLKFVTKDLIPFEIVSGAGFLDLAEALVKVGSALKSPSDLSEILHHPENFTPRLEVFAQRCRENLAGEMLQHVCSFGGGIVLETWESGKETYLSVSVHYIKDFSVVARFLSFSKLDPQFMMIEDYLKVQTMQSGSSYGISDWLLNFVYVCTRGSFIQAALKNVFKINCAAAPIVNALNCALSANQSDLTMLKTCRDVVGFFNRLNSSEEILIPSFSGADSQWETTLATCATVIENLNMIRTCISGTKWEDLFDTVVEKEVSDLFECLSPFQQALSEMNAKKQPTLYLVYLWHFKILDHLEDRPGDSQFISLFKASVKQQYLDWVEIDIVHKVAVFLHPLLKNLRMISNESEKMEVYEWVRYRVDEIKKIFGRDKEPESPKKPSGNPTRLSEALLLFMDTDNILNEREEDEVEKYQKMKLSEVVINGFDLLHWWHRQESQLPNLCVLANRLFAVPATSLHLFHCFSLPPRLFLERRSQLDPYCLDDILVSNSHHKYA